MQESQCPHRAVAESDAVNPEDQRFNARAIRATALAALLHIPWYVFYGWYMKVPDSLLCSDTSGHSFISFFPDCPEPRPFESIARFLIPIVGGLMVSTLTLALLRITPWRVNPLIHLYLGCAVSFATILAVAGLIFTLIVLAAM